MNSIPSNTIGEQLNNLIIKSLSNIIIKPKAANQAIWFEVRHKPMMLKRMKEAVTMFTRLLSTAIGYIGVRFFMLSTISSGLGGISEFWVITELIIIPILGDHP